MNTTTKWIVGVAVLVLVVWAIVAAQKNGNNQQQANNSPSNSQVAGDTYKVGVMLPLSGDAATYGEGGRNVYQIAADEINNSGGVNGKKLELIIEDSKCNGQDASNAMQKLVNIDKVQIVVGGFCSGESLAAQPIAESSKVTLFSPGSSSPKLTNIGRFFFRNYPSDASQGAVLADVSYNDKGYKKIALLEEQTDYALGLYTTFSAKIQSLGGSLAKEEFPTSTTDFRSQLTKLKAGKPDALFIDTQTPAATARILKQLKDLNWKLPLIINDATAGDTATIAQYKDILEGALTAEFGTDSSNAKFQHLVDAYKQKFGVDMPYQSYGQTEYDAIYMVRDGISAVGYDGQKLADWSRNIKDWEGASGKISIGADGDRASGHRPEIIKNGKVEIYTD